MDLKRTTLHADGANRYRRQLILPEIGIEGQMRLCQAKILVVGAGGLGSPNLLYLSAAGIGTLGIMDSDEIQISNLQRQVLYQTADIGQGKAHMAAQRIEALNPNIHTKVYPYRLTEDNAQAIINEYDLVIDATDNYATRRVIDNATLWCRKPFVYGAVQGFGGQVAIFNDPRKESSVRYQDLFADTQLADDAEEIGVVSAMPGVIGTIQAMEAIKWILELGDLLSGKLLSINLLTNEYQLFDF